MANITWDSIVESAAEQAAQTLIWFDEKAREVDGFTFLSAEGKAQKTRELAQKALKELSRIEAQVEAASKDFDAQVEGALADAPQVEPVVALLDEIRTQKAWQRIERRLNGITEPAALTRVISDHIRKAQEAKDAVALRTLLEELPDYLEARGVSMPHLAAELERAFYSLDPKKLDAYSKKEVFAQGYARVQAALRMARQAIEQGKPRSVSALPSWRLGGRVQIEW